LLPYIRGSSDKSQFLSLKCKQTPFLTDAIHSLLGRE
jgi:hypothetical protein